jgi:3-oxoadipate enol-lactonase
MSGSSDNGIFREVIGDGPPLVLLNGIMMTTVSWVMQTRSLAPHFRCIHHDFRGQLRSAKPPGPYSMSMHVDDLAALLDELGVESAHVAGTSYGGEVGMMFAAAHPSRVRSLAVIACVSRVDETLRRGVELWSRTARHEPERLWDVSLPFNYSPQFIAAHPELMAMGRERVGAFPREWFNSLADLCEAFLTLDVNLSAIRCPTLVIAGEHDALKPVRFSREIAEGIENAELVVIKDAGHAVVIEKPDAVNSELLRFLLRRGRALEDRQSCLSLGDRK